MQLPKPKFNFGNEVYRIQCNKKKGAIIDCNTCNGTGKVLIETFNLDCSRCNGIGKTREEYIEFSVDKFCPYVVTGLYIENLRDGFYYNLSYFSGEYDTFDLMNDISEDKLFINREEAEKECERLNQEQTQ